VKDRLKKMATPEIVAELEALPKDVAEKKPQDTIRNIGRVCHAMIAAGAEIARIMAGKSSLKL